MCFILLCHLSLSLCHPLFKQRYLIHAQVTYENMIKHDKIMFSYDF